MNQRSIKEFKNLDFYNNFEYIQRFCEANFLRKIFGIYISVTEYNTNYTIIILYNY